jgi:hypothetical protein
MFGSRLIFGSHFPFRVAQLRDARARGGKPPAMAGRRITGRRKNKGVIVCRLLRIQMFVPEH